MRRASSCQALKCARDRTRRARRRGHRRPGSARRSGSRHQTVPQPGPNRAWTAKPRLSSSMAWSNSPRNSPPGTTVYCDSTSLHFYDSLDDYYALTPPLVTAAHLIVFAFPGCGTNSRRRRQPTRRLAHRCPGRSHPSNRSPLTRRKRSCSRRPPNRRLASAACIVAPSSAACGEEAADARRRSLQPDAVLRMSPPQAPLRWAPGQSPAP